MSSSLADRLRGVVRPVGLLARPEGRPGSSDAVADVLGGCWVESRGQRYVVVDRSYGPGYRHGRIPLMDAMPPWPRLSLLGASSSAAEEKLLFIDVETTGLAGGAGTYAFLVGCGWFDGPTFRVRQFFLSACGAEPAMLDGLCDVAQRTGAIVSFNGKSFDLPLIETRYLFHRMRTPFEGLSHIDMLHPARRLWRPREADAAASSGGCRLSALERSLCGVAREGDVQGFEVPSRYFAYVRSGDARPLEAVLEHNRLDLVSLAVLTARASQLLDQGPAAARSAAEAVGLGRLYERGEVYDLARAAYARAVDLPSDSVTRTEALRCLAMLCRRLRRFSDAATAWQQLLEDRLCPGHIVREATEALAIHHEHRIRDLSAARSFALQVLRLEATVSRQRGLGVDARGAKAARHRLARLERKLAAPASGTLRF